MNELSVVQNYDDVERVAKAMVASGFFTDTKSISQAIVKIMAGAELGLPPFTSMSGIHIIQGKPALGSNIMATLVKSDPRYDYRVKQADNDACILIWYENGKTVGESSFTIQEAQNITTKENEKYIKLSEKATWRFYTSDMLFARAISRGTRRFAPGIFGGAPVYTPDEMGADVDEEGNVVTLPDNAFEIVAEATDETPRYLEPDEDEQSEEENVFETDDEAVWGVIKTKPEKKAEYSRKDAVQDVITGMEAKPSNKIRPYMEMNLEDAKAYIGGTDNKKYGDCTDKELEGKLIGLNAALLDSKASASRKEIYYSKRDAVITILSTRVQAKIDELEALTEE